MKPQHCLVRVGTRNGRGPTDAVTIASRMARAPLGGPADGWVGTTAGRGRRDRPRPAGAGAVVEVRAARRLARERRVERVEEDRKSTRLNSSHVKTSYAVF